MKKRIVATILACVLGTGLLAGCGNTADVTTETEASTEVDRIVETEMVDYEPVLPTAQEEADIFVEKIDGLAEDFIKGVDISTVLVQEKSGVVYYNEAGEVQDLFKTLADGNKTADLGGNLSTTEFTAKIISNLG